MGKVRAFFEEWRPTTVTGGAPIYPLLIFFGLNAVDELDRAAFRVLTPNIQDYFGLDIQGIITVGALAAVAALVLALPVGYIADRSNRVVLALIGASAWAVFSVLTGLAPAVWVLGVARFGSGLGELIIRPTHYPLLADYYDVSVRPKVYAVHRAANSVGQFIGPLAAGVLAALFFGGATRGGWRVPFIVFALPTTIVVILALKLRDPTRGGHERRATGASEETVGTEEAPPSYAEAWRILWNVKALRRIWYSLPFLGTAFIGLGQLLNIYYEEIFGLNEVQRGFIAAAAEPVQLIGLLLGVPIITRFMANNPARALWALGVVFGITAFGWAVFVVAPVVSIAIVANALVNTLLAIVVPGVLGALSVAIPPRARSMGFTAGALWYLPAALILIIIGGLADSMGVRPAMAMMIPVFIIGAIVITSAGPYLAADIKKVQTSTTASAEVRAARERGYVKLLLVKDLDVSYDSVQVLFGVNFEVDEGEIVALLGTNGAGKSTLLKSISGLVEAEAGAIVFDGRDMTYMPPNEIAAKGIMQVPGGRGVFPALTVEENLKAASWLSRRDQKYLDEAIQNVLGYFPVLKERWDMPAGNLSGGEQQMLTLSMAFISRPRLLMIDELSLGLAPIIVDQLINIVKAIRDKGTTIILVEQSVNIALTIAETAYFMEKGEIRFHGPTAELLDRPDILRSVFLEGAGSLVTKDQRPRARARKLMDQDGKQARGAEVLAVEELHLAYGGVVAVDDVSFKLYNGEILGVIGPNGAGKTTLFDLISGYATPQRGRIIFDGEDVTRMSPDTRAGRGLGRSFQDAKLFPSLTVEEAIALALERKVEVRDPVAAALLLPSVPQSEEKIAKRVDEIVDLLGLQAFRDKFVSELSTGSRRIVDLACVLAHEPTVILFDEPSSGIAQKETEALGPLLERVRDATSSSLLVIEHDMPLVTSIADEIIALDLGRVITQGQPDEVVHHPEVIASYLGSVEEVISRSGALGDGKPRRKSGKQTLRK